MNANFRRDYLYKAQGDITLKVKEGTLLRYLKYNRKTQEYIFLTGITRSSSEILLALPSSSTNKWNKLISREYCKGYQCTNGYRSDIGTVIKHSDLMVEGYKYNFTMVNYASDGVYISEKTLELDSMGDVLGFTFVSGPSGQRCHRCWLDDGLVTARVVG